jgi:lipoprotein-anchoring transpeptidase ErfK/SrfK
MKDWIALAVLMLAATGCDRAPSPAPSPTPAPAPVVIPAPNPVPVNDKLQTALALKHDGKLADARTALLALDPSDATVAALNEIDTQLLFTATPATEKLDYTIQAGDSLGKLAQKYGTTVELIRKANNISGDKIRVGDRLRIYQGKFAVEVSKTGNTLTVTDSGKFFKRYRVGTGQFSKTPVGEFKITSRIESPPWYRSDGKTVPYGDPDNILGTHWLGLNVPGYGLHGTWETNSIGKQSSAGCIRLLNDDVAELYIILPIGTPVTIHD